MTKKTELLRDSLEEAIVHIEALLRRQGGGSDFMKERVSQWKAALIEARK